MPAFSWPTECKPSARPAAKRQVQPPLHVGRRRRAMPPLTDARPSRRGFAMDETPDREGDAGLRPVPECAYTGSGPPLAGHRNAASHTGRAGRAPRYNDRDRASAPRAKRKAIVQRPGCTFFPADCRATRGSPRGLGAGPLLRQPGWSMPDGRTGTAAACRQAASHCAPPPCSGSTYTTEAVRPSSFATTST